MLAEFEQSGGAPNVVMYTSLIEGCLKNGNLEKAQKLFVKMRAVGLVPNEFTNTVMISGCFKNGRRDDGLRLYAEMKNNGVIL